jgi:hypothetical protein
LKYGVAAETAQDHAAVWVHTGDQVLVTIQNDQSKLRQINIFVFVLQDQVAVQLLVADNADIQVG